MFGEPLGDYPWVSMIGSTVWGSYGLQAIGKLGFVWVVTKLGHPSKRWEKPITIHREKNRPVLTWTSPWTMDELCPARQGIVHGKPFTGSHLKVGNSCPEQGRHRHWTDGLMGNLGKHGELTPYRGSCRGSCRYSNQWFGSRWFTRSVAMRQPMIWGVSPLWKLRLPRIPSLSHHLPH